jgi:hypothetical protein
VPFNKEPYMVGLNNFVITNKDKLSNSLDRLSVSVCSDGIVFICVAAGATSSGSAQTGS